MRSRPILLALFVALVPLGVGAIDVASIPTPRPDGWVADTAGLLDEAAVARINAIGDAVHARDGAEIAVVTVPTTGGADARRFATDLFNHWQIGHAERDNGVLVFVAIEDRAAELILGDGIDDDAQVAIADVIMQGVMVPRFREGDPAGALVAGTETVAMRLFGLDPGTLATLAPGSSATPVAAAEPPREDLASSLSALASDPEAQAIGLGVGGTGLLGGLVLGVRRYLRFRPRRCDRCGGQMTRLDETGDDAHLGPAELKEEQLRSVDYDLWACSACRHVEKLRYGAWFTSYAKCPQCRAVTKSSAETTLVAATYDHGGRVRVDEECQFCGYRNSFERATPKKTRSSSSSSSGFGGGSSSGRGSSGRW